MNSPQHKRHYSFIYKIYRRIRFIRYKRKLKKREEQESRQAEKNVKEDLKRSYIQHRQAEAEQLRLQQKAEREAQKKRKAELEQEFRERELLAREEWKRLSESDRVRLKARLEEEEKERNLQRSILKKQRRIALRRFLNSLTLRNFRENLKTFRENAPTRRLFYIITGNSTVLFVLSYFILYLFYQVVTVIAGSFFDYPTIAYYWEIYFNIGTEDWYHDSVKTIFASGPLILFILGISCLIVYTNIKEMEGNLKLFFLWAFLHGTNMLFGALLVGTLFETGVGHVISWMYIMDTGRVLYSIISIFILVMAGLVSARLFLISGNAYFNEVTSANRGFLLRSQVLMPFLLGNAIIFAIRQPHFMYYETFTNLVMVLTLLPIFVTAGTAHDLFFDEDERKPGIQWIPIIVLLAVILFYRGVLSAGLRFGS